MGRIPELLIEVDETWRSKLRELVKAEGQQAVADKASVDQGSVSRLLVERKPVTYTMAKKVADAVNAPPPVVPVRDREHEEWCRLGARLAELAPTLFARRLADIRDAVKLAEIDPEARIDEAAAERAKAAFRNPLPKRSAKRDRGG